MRNKLKAFFSNNPTVKIKTKELARKLDISEDHEYKKLKAFLHKLEKDEFIEKQGKRYKLKTAEDHRLIGKLQLIGQGDFGFVILQNKKMNDIYVSERNLGTAFDGDTVEVALFARQRGKNLEGQIINVVQRKKEELAGTLRKTKSFYFVEPENPKIHRDFYIADEFLNGAAEGDKVIIDNIDWKNHLLNPEARIKEVLGRAGTYDAEIAALAQELDLNYRFPPRVIEEAEEIPLEISEDEIKKRLDLRNELIFTIDPLTAKDFDDAVSIKQLDNGNFSVGIHIADVSHYMDDNSSIFEEALDRATSVYLVGKVIPMLPERLSNNICSLVPNEDRLTFSVIVELTPGGKIVSYDIEKTVINSKRRYTYEEVQDILETQKGDNVDQLLLLNKIAKTLRANRTRTGSINFSTPEVEFLLDENGKAVDVKIKTSNESHNLIEELMLLANKIVAGHVNKTKDNVPFIYRVHDLPDETKLQEFASFVKSLGYSFDPKAAKKPKLFQQLFEQVKGSPEEALINEIGIRSMAKAVYATHNIGHYGLAFRNYTHFTSPIRRFPDLMVHKALFYYLKNKKQDKYSQKELEDIADHSSVQERNAISAERLSIKLKQIEYLKDKVGYDFNAVISGVTNFGMFVELEESLAEGFVHVRDMEGDYFVHDEKNYALIGESTGASYKLGDKVKVKLARVDETKRVMDFILID